MNSRQVFSIVILFLCVFPAVGVFSEGRVITVEAGDTLYSIGRKYDVSVQDLIAVNGIVNPRALKEGMELTIPVKNNTHVVSAGETLYGIARNNGISVAILCELNEISEDSVIKIGQLLKVPGDEAVDDVAVANSAGGTSHEDDEISTESEHDDTADSISRDNNTVNVSYHEITEGKEVFWPHEGKRSALHGKLQGTQILGSRGDQVVSVNSGEVVWVAPYRGYGTLVMVESKDHHIYAYGGNEITYVEVGQKISVGTVIGRVGINPIEKTAKVFFFVYKNGKPVDPAAAPRG